jgi:hypothetical protein
MNAMWLVYLRIATITNTSSPLPPLNISPNGVTNRDLSAGCMLVAGAGLFRLPAFLEGCNGGVVKKQAEPVVCDLLPGIVRVDAKGGFQQAAHEVSVCHYPQRLQPLFAWPCICSPGCMFLWW